MTDGHGRDSTVANGGDGGGDARELRSERTCVEARVDDEHVRIGEFRLDWRWNHEAVLMAAKRMMTVWVVCSLLLSISRDDSVPSSPGQDFERDAAMPVAPASCPDAKFGAGTGRLRLPGTNQPRPRSGLVSW